MRYYKNFSVTLPPEMLEEVERACKEEHRSRSELVREALRVYFAKKRIPVAEIAPEELAEIDEARAEVARGEYVTLEHLRHELGHTRR